MVQSLSCINSRSFFVSTRGTSAPRASSSSGEDGEEGVPSIVALIALAKKSVRQETSLIGTIRIAIS